MNIVSKLKWLYPGMKIKRYILLLPFGLLFIILGTALFVNQTYDYIIRKIGIYALQIYGINVGNKWHLVFIATFFIIFGIFIIFYVIKLILYSVVNAVSPDNAPIVERVFEKRLLVSGPNIVVIGGGTGLSTMLRGLKQYTSNLTAVVTVSDNGGSSGRLKQEFGILPPGDIRNCLVAMAGREDVMEQLLQYRFDNGNDGIKGHSFGNLMLGALTDITGDFESAVSQLSDILAIRGKVFPASLVPVELVAKFADGKEIVGETEIVAYGKKIDRLYLNQNPVPSLDAIDSILKADMIVLGPGSLYTSVISNLLVKEIKEAVIKSKAKKVYVCNVMTQPGETDNFTAFDHFKTLRSYLDNTNLDYCIVNNEKPMEDVLKIYEQQNQEYVEYSADEFKNSYTEVIADDFMHKSNMVRHDFSRLSETIIRLIENEI